MRAEVELLSLGMSPGTSIREICPKCGGGQGKEKSLSITVSDEGMLLWNCYRASCGFKGKRLVWGVVQEGRGDPKKAPKVFDGALVPFPKEIQHWFKEVFGLNPEILEQLGWRFAPDSQRLYIPFRGPKEEFRGSLLRHWYEADSEVPCGPKLTPKSYVYKEDMEAPFINWLPQHKSRMPLVIVEDALSAAKVFQAGINALSLGGTHLSLAMLREIVRFHDSAIIALDKDATQKAVGLVGTYRHLIGLSMWKLEKDLKYVKEERIREAYFDGKTDFSSGHQEPQSIR